LGKKKGVKVHLLRRHEKVPPGPSSSKPKRKKRGNPAPPKAYWGKEKKQVKLFHFSQVGLTGHIITAEEGKGKALFK